MQIKRLLSFILAFQEQIRNLIHYGFTRLLYQGHFMYIKWNYVNLRDYCTKVILCTSSETMLIYEIIVQGHLMYIKWH